MTEEPLLWLARRKIVDFCSAFRLAERQTQRSRWVTSNPLAMMTAFALPVW
jgi:hypothetical protein